MMEVTEKRNFVGNVSLYLREALHVFILIQR